MHKDASRLLSYKGYDADEGACGAATLGNAKPTDGMHYTPCSYKIPR